MLVTHGKEDGSYEQRKKMQRSYRGPEVTPGAMAGDVGAERLDKTVH
jgi:hypothetical protein